MRLLFSGNNKFGSVVFLAVDDLKTIEVEKCKADIKNIRDQIYSTHKKIAECNTLRYGRVAFLLILRLHVLTTVNTTIAANIYLSFRFRF